MTPAQTQPLGLPKTTLGNFKRLALKIKFFLGSLFYLTYAPKAYRYSSQRDRLEQQFLAPPAPEIIDSPGKLLRVEHSARGADVYFERAELEICFLKTDFVLLNWKPGLAPVPYALAKSVDGAAWQEWSEVMVTLYEVPDGWIVSGGDVQVYVSEDGSLRFYDSTGQLLRQEMPPRREGEAWSHQVQLRPEENLYGLGERAAHLNLRSNSIAQELDSSNSQPTQTYRMWNYDAAGMYGPGSDPMYISIPVYLSLHQQGSYLVFTRTRLTPR